MFDSKTTRAVSVVAGCISFIVYAVYQRTYHFTQLERVKHEESDFPIENHPFTSHLKAATSTWPIVVTYQCLWTIYSLITIVRWKSLQILPIYFYALWCAACYFDIGSSFLAADDNLLFSWTCACAGVLSRYGCLFFAFDGLFEYLAAHKGVHKPPSSFDVCCQRVFIQNGLLCFQAWSSFTVSVLFSSVLQHAFNASQTSAQCLSLVILIVALIMWFLAQNFFIEKYTRYTLAEYVTFAIVSGLFFGHCRSEVNGTFAFALVFLCLAVLLCIFRVCLIFHSEGERKLATDDELEFMT